MKVKFTFLLIVCAMFSNTINASGHRVTNAPYQKITGNPFTINAYKELYGRSPNMWEQNLFNYNNGSWSSYDNFKTYVFQFQNSINSYNIKFAFGPARNKDQVIVGFIVNKQLIAADVILKVSGYIVSSGGSSVIAAGGNTVTLKGAGSFKVTKTTPGAVFGGAKMDIPKGAQRFLTSGIGALIIK